MIEIVYTIMIIDDIFKIISYVIMVIDELLLLLLLLIVYICLYTIEYIIREIYHILK